MANNGDGGAIYNTEALALATSSLDHNSATYYGGGIFNGGTLIVTNSSLAANSAQSPLPWAYGAGGGIYIGGGTATLTNSTLSANSAAYYGGGIYIRLGTLTVTNSALSGNAAGAHGNGGGIYTYRGTLTVTNSNLSGNNAESGGGIFTFYGTVTVTNSTLSGNNAVNGGGIYVFYYAAVMVTNSTLSGNAVSSAGGGIYVTSGGGGIATLTLTNSTMVANRADRNGTGNGIGGGVYNLGNATLFNSIVAGNLKGSGAGVQNDLDGTNLLAASAFNLIGDPSSSGGLTNGTGGNIVGKNNGTQVLPLAEILDPTLRNNGGPTLTHALVPSSAAIDAGDNGRVATIPFDQRGPGFNRIINGQVDIGAFEMHANFTDNFNQPDGTGLSANWTPLVGNFQVLGNAATATNPAPAVNLATLVGVQPANVELQANVTLVTTGHEIDLVAGHRGPADAHYYMARVLKRASGYSLSILKNIGGTAKLLTLINTATLTGPIKFRIEGASLKLFMNNVQMLSVSDSSFPAGNVGIRSIGTGTIDNFSATPVNFLPFADNFDADTPNVNWSMHTGGYSMTAVPGQAKGTAAQNLMTLRRFDLSDVDVQADFNVPAVAGQVASLFARYSGPTDKSMYFASVSYIGNQYVASIAKKVGGVTTTLASVYIGSGVGTLRFTVIGGQLTFYLNGTKLLSAYDFTLKSGSVGIRSSLDPTFDNFSAKQAS